MKQRLQTFDNSVDGHCFACGQLWDNTTHVLTCSCDACSAARATALMTFQWKLTKMHTPDVLSHLLRTSMESWLARRPVLPPEWTGTEEPIQREIRTAFREQARIRWDQFFCGRIAQAWKIPIGTYYKIRKPGKPFTPDNWMRNVIKELWDFSIAIWKQRNLELHGQNGAILMEQHQKDTAMEAASVYQEH